MKLGILGLFGRARTYFVFICNIWSARALYSNFKICVARAIDRDFGFCIEWVVGLFVDRLIVLVWDFGKRIGFLLCVRKSSEYI